MRSFRFTEIRPYDLNIYKLWMLQFHREADIIKECKGKEHSRQKNWHVKGITCAGSRRKAQGNPPLEVRKVKVGEVSLLKVLRVVGSRSGKWTWVSLIPKSLHTWLLKMSSSEHVLWVWLCAMLFVYIMSLSAYNHPVVFLTILQMIKLQPLWLSNLSKNS